MDQSQIQLTGTVMRLDRVPAELRAVGRDTFSVCVRACDSSTAPCRDNSCWHSDCCGEPRDEIIETDLVAAKVTCLPLLLLSFAIVDECLMFSGFTTQFPAPPPEPETESKAAEAVTAEVVVEPLASPTADSKPAGGKGKAAADLPKLLQVPFLSVGRPLL